MDGIRIDAKIAKDTPMSEEERERCLAEPVTRGEMYDVLLALMAEEIEPFINGKFAFEITVMRHMFASSGIMSPDAFNAAYQTFMDAFTQRFDGKANAQETGRKKTEEPLS